MSNFKNVNVDKLANIYYEGKVISRNIFLRDGSKKTLGTMLVGEYEFDTKSRELMEIISGELFFKIKGDNDWNFVKEGMEFYVPKDSSFSLKIMKIVNYTCSYIL